MKTQTSNLKTAVQSLAALLCLVLAPIGLAAQGAATAPQVKVDEFAGNYKGTAKNPAGDTSLVLEIKIDAGKVSGRLVESQNEQPITSGEIVGGRLVVKVGSGSGAGTLTLQQQEAKLVGEWAVGGQEHAVEFTKEPSVTEILTGVWDAAADVQGQALPFTLVLKVEGEKVTGSSSSQLGDSTISSGTYKDGKLAFMLDGANGQIGMMATLTDGKLAGDFDSGQLQGKWVATKRK